MVIQLISLKDANIPLNMVGLGCLKHFSIKIDYSKSLNIDSENKKV